MHPNEVAYNMSGQWSNSSYSWLPPGIQGHGHSHGPGQQCQGHHGNGQGHGHGHSHGPGGHGHSHGGGSGENFGKFMGPAMKWSGGAAGDDDDDEEGDRNQEYPKPVGDYSTRINFFNIPLLGRFQFLNDQRGICQIGFIYFYWIYGMWFNNFIVLLPHYREGHISLLPFILFITFSACCLISLFRASTTNPGRVAYTEDKYPVPSDDSSWVFCKKCHRKRPPNSHHCSRCQHCTVGMDHHCPWINNCVGSENHYLFILLLIYAGAMSSTSVILICLHYFYWPDRLMTDFTAFPQNIETLFFVIGIFMSSAMALAMLGLLGTQHLGIVTGMSTIDMMRYKAEVEMSGEVFTPASLYHMAKPWVPSYRVICGKGVVPSWFLPCRRRVAVPTSERLLV